MAVAALVERLLTTDESPAVEVPAGNATNVGFKDLAGQLRGALDQFSGVRLVPFWVVGTLVFGYILLIGPVDYWLVKKVFKRMELTWLTFPTIVVTVSLAAYLAAYWTKGNKLLVNQVDLIDIENSSGQLRGTSWLNVFSPTTSTYDLTLATPLPSLPRQVVLDCCFLARLAGRRLPGRPCRPHMPDRVCSRSRIR